LQVALGKTNEYDRAKGILNRGKHPTFIGKTMVQRNALQGGLLFCIVDGKDAAAALVNVRNSTLLVLNVLPEFRSRGVGARFLSFIRPNFARVVSFAVPWFERQGYVAIGEPKQGRKLATQIMARKELFSLAGRVSKAFAEGCRCDAITAAGQATLLVKPPSE